MFLGHFGGGVKLKSIERRSPVGVMGHGIVQLTCRSTAASPCCPYVTLKNNTAPCLPFSPTWQVLGALKQRDAPLTPRHKRDGAGRIGQRLAGIVLDQSFDEGALPHLERGRERETEHARVHARVCVYARVCVCIYRQW